AVACHVKKQKKLGFIVSTSFSILLYSMKIKEQTRKLAADCSKHCFEVVDRTDEVSSKHGFEVVDEATLT
ncbi:hypothetical protein, partial [Streptococcus pseudopneumoniae]